MPKQRKSQEVELPQKSSGQLSRKFRRRWH